MLRCLAAMAVIFTILGCNREPTVSAGGSEDEMKDSIAQVKESLPDDRRKEFEEAMQTLLFADIDNLGDLADSDGMVRRLKDRIDGKTGEEIIAEASRVQADREERQRQEAIAEIEELAAKLDPATEKLCADFVVERSRFHRDGGGYLGNDASIELVVRNGTEHAISRAYFHALLVTPGRAVPWIDAEFNYSIPGGLEPGETAEWNLRPSMFGEWSNAPRDRYDTVFVVRAVSLDGPDGESLTANRLTQAHEDRIRALLDSVEYERAESIRADLAARSTMIEQWREAATRRAVLSELASMRARKSEADSARANLEKFEVTRSRFYWRESAFSWDPVIEITVHNGTNETVAGVWANGILATPGREAPWVEDRIWARVRGGLEPGDTKQLELTQRFSAWSGAPRDRDDMVLTVTVESLEGVNDEKLYDVPWEPEDEARLIAMESLVADQGWE